jgi:hypothetical protein
MECKNGYPNNTVILTKEESCLGYQSNIAIILLVDTDINEGSSRQDSSKVGMTLANGIHFKIFRFL